MMWDALLYWGLFSLVGLVGVLFCMPFLDLERGIKAEERELNLRDEGCRVLPSDKSDGLPISGSER